MSAADRSTQDIVTSLLDGRSVNWEKAETEALDEEDRAIVRELRVLAEISELSRTQRSGGFEGFGESSAEASGEAADLELDRWGHLLVLERIGKGGFSEVFWAWDTRVERDVALKVLRAPQAAAEDAATVIQEARMLARVKHPNVVTV